ncbi:MAG: hypothetical protein JWN30_2423 [Bacilli bacterium]|nr:hypothetical protein [Bacilli bacterium]
MAKGGPPLANSMTGFARVQLETDGQIVTVELKSVNHRYLDVQYRMPRQVHMLEERLKSILHKQVARGRVEVYVQFEAGGNSESAGSINRPLLKQILSELSELAVEYSIAGPVAWDALLSIPAIWQENASGEGAEHSLELVEKAFSEAVSELVQVRAREGRQLVQELGARVLALQQLLTELDDLAASMPGLAMQKWQERLSVLLQAVTIDEARVLQEAAILADRMSIEEELVRLRIHTEHFLNMLEQDGPVGRKLDFLLQEMNREMNTAGVKSSSSAISQLVVDGKTMLEQCREQVQNLE